MGILGEELLCDKVVVKVSGNKSNHAENEEYAPIFTDRIKADSCNTCNDHNVEAKVGDVVTATAVLTEVNGRELKFNIAARDEVSLIGEGTHTRFVVNREKFMAKLK